MSGKMAAIVGYIINEKFTDPTIEDMVVTSDHFVLAQVEGDIGYNEFIGHESDLESNWKRLLIAADLTNEEMTEANNLYKEKFGDNRQFD
jgi:hypothetical protein